MEIKIYRSLDLFTKGKHFFCARVECLECFDFAKTIDVFRSIYGTGIVILLIVV